MQRLNTPQAPDSVGTSDNGSRLVGLHTPGSAPEKQNLLFREVRR